MRVAGVVLTGGASRRMGTDKAFVVVGGRTMVDAVVAALRQGGCDDVRCVGGDVERLRAAGHVAVPDPAPGIGPTAAIAAALDDAADVTVVAACDLPYLTPDVVARLRRAASGGATAVAVAGGRHHLALAIHAATAGEWRRSAAAGVHPVRTVLDGVAATGRLVEVAVDEGVVRNVNRPDDVVRRAPPVRDDAG